MKDSMITEQLQQSGLVYLQVRESLRNRINKMKHGDRLPSERSLSSHFKVARATVGRAIESLEQEGFVVRHQGRGTFVKRIFESDAAVGTKKGTIGLVMPINELPCHKRLFDSIQENATHLGYQLLVCNSDFNTSQEEGLLLDLLNEDLTGILVYPMYEDSKNKNYAGVIKKLEDNGKQIVLMDQYVSSMRTRAVLTNYMEVGYIATEHLISLGHTRICYISSGGYDVSGQAAVNGYRAALRDNNLPYVEDLVINIPVPFCAKPSREAVKRLLGDNPWKVSAIAVSNFSMTHGAMNALSDLKLRAPQEIAVIGCDTFQNPSLSHVSHIQQQFEEIGKVAINWILQGQDMVSLKRRWFISPKLVIGDTCGSF